MPEASEVEIERLGAKGDGVAALDGKPVYIPFALPGERWQVEDTGALRTTTSPERRAPICRHFGQCGGCTAQHMSRELYDQWKRSIVADAFRHRGIAAEIAPLRRVSLNSRRRAHLGVRRQGDEIILGFREEGRHNLVDLEECPVLDPLIVVAARVLKEMARLVLPEGQGGRVLVTRLDDGLDVAFENAREQPSAANRAELAALAGAQRLVRLTVGAELIALPGGHATITIAGVATEPPPGVFVQPVAEAEAMLIDLVEKAVPKRAKRVADLFSGLGTFAFALARRATVAAFDGDKRAIAALEAGARRATGLKPIEARARDLFREPLSARELNSFDAVVFDPPRAGAAAQAERIGASKVPVVVAVSCNPATLARDARILIDGGLTMGPVTPIDQFLFSPHVEAVAVFER